MNILDKKTMANRQSNSYQRMMEHYDDLLTGRKWWSRIYMRFIWNEDTNLLARKVLDLIPDDFRGRLLDVPVGTAIFTAEKYRRMKDAEIVGLDYSEEMIAIAALRKETEEIANLSLEQGDVGELPYSNEIFDCVLSMNGFQAFPEKEKAFAEIFRVLKPGGVFMITNETSGKTGAHEKWMKIVDGMSVYTGEELEALLTGAGFARVEIDEDLKADRLNVRAYKA